MATVTFITHAGERHDVALIPGQSLMELATENGVPGIDGDCGGFCACGTCHVMLSAAAIADLGSSGPDEDVMLNMSSERTPHSRLGCQVRVSLAQDGLEVHLPQFQL